uniref:Uncharacterized protein n=1 Tax=Cajanus cajan TaxID=3821 RepID=A0A151UCW6_CAJCA|nr:hypothetical protein KK1_021395 [Cajanus cajan]
MIWRGELQGNFSHKLKSISLLIFHVESNVFPYRFLQVPNIEELWVELLLESLPELVSFDLENLWIESFLKNLEHLKVNCCSHLKNLAPSSICFSEQVQKFIQPKIMMVTRCEFIKEIVYKEGDESNEEEIIFPLLNCLILEYLPNLVCFYRGNLMETLCTGIGKIDKMLRVNKFQENPCYPFGN